jgi:hypothetical protein
VPPGPGRAAPLAGAGRAQRPRGSSIGGLKGMPLIRVLAVLSWRGQQAA